MERTQSIQFHEATKVQIDGIPSVWAMAVETRQPIIAYETQGRVPHRAFGPITMTLHLCKKPESVGERLAREDCERIMEAKRKSEREARMVEFGIDPESPHAEDDLNAAEYAQYDIE